MATHRESWEAKVYKDAGGAEAGGAHATVEGLHLHDPHGREECGGPLAGRSEPFSPVKGSATTKAEDPPVKLQGHSYKHDELDTDIVKDAAGTDAAAAEASVQGGAAESPVAAPDVPPALQDIAHEEEPPSQQGGTGAAAGMVAHGKDFEATMAQEVKGAETPDGDLQALHLHTEHGDEGPGSRADRQLQALVEGGSGPTATSREGGAYATSSDIPQDPPDKIMMHTREEVGAHPITVTSEDIDQPSGSLKPAVAEAGGHTKGFEAVIEEEAKGAESPDGGVQALHLHTEHGDEGAGSRADRQLQALVEEMKEGGGGGATPGRESGAYATPSDIDPPDKMMPHRREEVGAHHPSEGAPAAEEAAGTAGAEETEGTVGAEKTEGATSTMEHSGQEPLGGVVKPEGLLRVAEAMAEAVGGPVARQLNEEGAAAHGVHITPKAGVGAALAEDATRARDQATA